MKFIIKHEIPGRIRVHMVQPKMTFEEADILLYYLVNLENVTKAKVYERTQDAVIYYEKDRREIIKALQKFGYDRVTVPEGLTEHSGRQMNAEYQEKLLMKVVMRFWWEASDTGTGTGGLDRCPFSEISAAGDRESGKRQTGSGGSGCNCDRCFHPAQRYEYRKFDHVHARYRRITGGMDT